MGCGCGSFGIFSPESAMWRPWESFCRKTINPALGALLFPTKVPEVTMTLQEVAALQLIRTPWNWFSLSHCSSVLAELRNGILKRIPLPETREAICWPSHFFLPSMFPVLLMRGIAILFSNFWGELKWTFLYYERNKDKVPYRVGDKYVRKS